METFKQQEETKAKQLGGKRRCTGNEVSAEKKEQQTKIQEAAEGKAEEIQKLLATLAKVVEDRDKLHKDFDMVANGIAPEPEPPLGADGRQSG